MQLPEGFHTSTFSQTLGCRILDVADGVARVALALQPHLHNRAGQLHGGAIFSLVDIAMGLACSCSHGFEERSVTLECKINYLRGVAAGEVECEARVIHAGRRTLVVEADVLQNDMLVAKAQGTFARV
jgi:acyl-CoA thioesterase